MKGENASEEKAAPLPDSAEFFALISLKKDRLFAKRKEGSDVKTTSTGMKNIFVFIVYSPLFY